LKDVKIFDKETFMGKPYKMRTQHGTTCVQLQEKLKDGALLSSPYPTWVMTTTLVYAKELLLVMIVKPDI
jgi:hypothetical protein